MWSFAAGCRRGLSCRGLTEKYLLKQLGREWLPEDVWQRPKRPYRAPIHRCFFNDARLSYVDDLLAPDALAATGLFRPAAVQQLTAKLRHGQGLSETDDMALIGILSTQLLVQQFLGDFKPLPPLSDNDDVKVCRGHGAFEPVHG